MLVTDTGPCLPLKRLKEMAAILSKVSFTPDLFGSLQIVSIYCNIDKSG